MRRRDFLKASGPALALPVVCASESRAAPQPAELTIERVINNDCWLRGVGEGDWAIVHSEPGYRADNVYLAPDGGAVRVQRSAVDGIRVFVDGSLSDDGKRIPKIFAEGLTEGEFAAAGYRFIEAVFYQSEGDNRWTQANMFRSDDEVVLVDRMSAEEMRKRPLV